MNIGVFLYALQSCITTYHGIPTVFVDLFDCKYTKERVCYLSTQWESWRPDSKDFPKEAIGLPIKGWPNERWVDIRDSRIRAIMLKRMDLAKKKGCMGIDPDNVDGFTTKTGFPLTAKDQADFIAWMSYEAHKRGLKIGLKNSAETAKKLSPLVDFHVAEQCTDYKECDKYPAGKTFFIEYRKKTPATEAMICPKRPYTLFANSELSDFERCGK